MFDERRPDMISSSKIDESPEDRRAGSRWLATLFLLSLLTAIILLALTLMVIQSVPMRQHFTLALPVQILTGQTAQSQAQAQAHSQAQFGQKDYYDRIPAAERLVVPVSN